MSEHWPKTLNYNFKNPSSNVKLFNIQKVKKKTHFFVLLSNMKIILSVSQSVCRYLNFPQIIRVCMSVSQSVNSQKTKSNLKQQFSTKGNTTYHQFLGWPFTKIIYKNITIKLYQKETYNALHKFR
jgi:hypothetical protein